MKFAGLNVLPLLSGHNVCVVCNNIKPLFKSPAEMCLKCWLDWWDATLVLNTKHMSKYQLNQLKQRGALNAISFAMHVLNSKLW